MADYKIKNRVEVAKIGTWNDIDITEDILKEVVSYNKGQKAPVRPGHVDIKPGDKAHGYLENPSYEKGSLYFDQVLYDDTARDFENGYFINRSMDLSKRNGKYMVSALALLGSEAPGIKGLKTFKDNEENEVLRFTQKINEEVIMPESKQFSEIFEQGQRSKESEFTLKFNEEKKTALADQEKELTLKFNDKLKEKDSKIEELEKKVEETEKKRFSDKIAEVKAEFPEEKQGAIETELKEFADAITDFKVFAKVADMKKPVKAEFSEKKYDFSEKQSEEKKVNTANNI